MSLTKRQKEILDFIRGFIGEKGYSPSIEEIGAHFGFASPNAVFKHLKALEKRGFIHRHTHSARSIEIVGGTPNNAFDQVVELPLAGTIAAGRPIDAIEDVETLTVPTDFTGPGTHYVLRVKGDSMIDEHIQDGDLVIVHETNHAENGDLVVAIIDGEKATLKRYFRQGATIRLQPANPAIEPIFVDEHRLTIRGIVVGVMRKYR